MNRQNILISLFLIAAFAELPAQCWPTGFTHDTRPQAQWLSCEPAPSPNPARGEGIWLFYQFDFPYGLGATTIWNYNEPGFLAFGAGRLAIDYSLDGETWTAWGELELDPATGRRDYPGQAGPDFGGAAARYVLFTVLETGEPDMTCAGLAEVRFEIDNLTASEEIPADQDLQVFPNPTRDVLWLRLPGGRLSEIVLFDAQGKPVWRRTPRQEQVSVNVEALPAGLYLLQGVDDRGRVYQEKVSIF